ncbi:MAG: Lamin Tail Domain, partial [Bacteroidota bacterium]
MGLLKEGPDLSRMWGFLSGLPGLCRIMRHGSTVAPLCNLHRNSKNVARDKDLYTGDCTFRGILPQKYPMSLLNLFFLGILTFLFTPSGALVLHTPRPGELLISEIMADPSPGAGSWPECEYLELFNPTERTLLLRDIQLRAGGRTV